MNIDVYDNNDGKCYQTATICYQTATCPLCNGPVTYYPKEVKYVLICDKCGNTIMLGE